MVEMRVSKRGKGRDVHARRAQGVRPSIGIESEFTVLVDGKAVRPEELFGTPTHIVRAPMMHRIGRSYHLPTGAAIYFDSGVIELATPMIEIEPGCAARAGRSLWEGIGYLRRELDAWEVANNQRIELAGFSTHYNVSFDLPSAQSDACRTIEKFALLQTHILPIPVMLLAANPRSTGIGVRPRGDRVELTADFTPDPSLMIATATCVVGVMRDVMRWPTFELSTLDTTTIPVVRDFTPERHRTRRGWVARYTSFASNPFTTDVDEQTWETRAGESLSLRTLAARVANHFWPSIRHLGDVRSLDLISSITGGARRSLLEAGDRPASYESVGRLCRWNNTFPVRSLPRSGYERVLHHAISRRTLTLEQEPFTPTGMRGWSGVVFRRERDGSRHVFSLDFLLDHIDDWGKPVRRNATNRHDPCISSGQTSSIPASRSLRS